MRSKAPDGVDNRPRSRSDARKHFANGRLIAQIRTVIVDTRNWIRWRRTAHGVHPCSAGAVLRDRKSTRLNSSHVAISYAVFCLKKKNRRCGNQAEPLAAISVHMR